MATNYDVFLPYSGETVTQAQWQDYINCLGADGVTTQLNGTNALAVVQRGAGANKSVDVSAGRILQQGMRAENSTTKNLVIADNTSGNPRIDRIVSRWTPGSTDMELDVLQGTPAGSPTAPALTQNATTYEVSLAQIAVASGFVSIVTANITDERAWSGPQAVRIPSVASAATLNVNFYTSNPGWYEVPVSGTTTITAINTGPAGSVIILEFASANCIVTNAGTLKLSAAYTSTTLSTLTLYSDGTNWVELARSVASSASVASLSNVCMNGEFGVWQRGTSIALTTGTPYTADRWRYVNIAAGPATITLTQDTAVPTVAANAAGTAYAMKATVTGADAAIAAGDLYLFQNFVEGPEAGALMNGGSLSFWVRAFRTGKYCVSFVNQATNRSWVTEYDVNASNTWEYKTISFTAPTGTWLMTPGSIGLRLSFTLAAGSTFQTTANAWQNGNFYATANQVNGVGAATDIFSLALVNLVSGATAYPLSPRPYQALLGDCQRYFQVLASGNNDPIITGQCYSTTQALGNRPLPVEMCATPTLNVSNAGHFSVTTAAGAGQALNALAIYLATPRNLALNGTAAAATLVAGNATMFYSSNASATLTAEANPT